MFDIKPTKEEKLASLNDEANQLSKTARELTLFIESKQRDLEVVTARFTKVAKMITDLSEEK